MKLKCNQDHWAAETGNFLGIGNKPRTKIEGLTEGKTYDGSPIGMTSGDGNLGFGSIETEIKFLIYNDDNEWVDYQLNLFSPI